ncbi:MAG: hypothetical protein Q4B77_00455 [Coriobacteriaceae bacterium]|nr:hypothetical protein [Coriobacteriaceae bacterium]
MAVPTTEKKEALAAAVEQELASLQARGVIAVGNAFSPVLLIKGALNEDELAGGALLAGADGAALRSALSAIGWEPQDFCALSAVRFAAAGAAGEEGAAGAVGSIGGAGSADGAGDVEAASDAAGAASAAAANDAAIAAGASADGAAPRVEALSPELFREAVEALDPEAIILLDTPAADVMRETYADALAIIEDFDTAMLKPGLIASVLGRRVLALDGFEASLGVPAEKQRMWAYLKQLKPLGAPY